MILFGKLQALNQCREPCVGTKRIHFGIERQISDMRIPFIVGSRQIFESLIFLSEGTVRGEDTKRKSMHAKLI